jgi:serine/threonine-protein kinase
LASEFDRLQESLPERYTLVRHLDQGGLSTVYLAREALPDRDVVIKVLDEELSAGLGRARFIRDVEVTSKLQHPHILPIHAAGDAGGRLYYVMPYIEGESLRDRLDRGEPLGIDEALRITGQVAEALQHAHDKGIVHRDLKPSKILFQSGHAVVSDFGIARALRAADRDRGPAHSRVVRTRAVGSPDYLSPEQFGEDAPIGQSTDTYALACIVYEMLSGRTPFPGGKRRGTPARPSGDEAPPLTAIRPDLPQAVEGVIAGALATSPADRPATVSAFARALVAARGPDASSRNGARGQSLPWWSRIAAGLLLVVAGAAAVQMWSAVANADGAWRASVAVMPFENRTGDTTYDNLGQSLAEEVITRLTAVPELRVIDPYTAASLMNDSLGTPRLLDTLNVEHILHGYVEARGDELVVNVSESNVGGFLSPRTQHRIDPGDVDRAQSALADAIASRFLERVGLGDRFDPGGSVIGPGRDAYLAGNAAMGRRTPEGMRDAVVWFREAIRLEPTSATALSALSSAYALALYYKYDVGIPSYQLAARSLAAADSAIQEGPDVANGYSARGYIRALLGIDLEGAEADFARAEALAPNAPNGPSWSARILAEKGQIDEAFAEAARARDLDPLQAGRRTALASLGFQLGRYDVAIEEARIAYRLESQLSLARAFEGRALALTGRGGECQALDFGVYALVRALCLHTLGRAAEARRLVDAAEQQLEQGTLADADYMPELVAQDLASYYGLAGDVRGAERWLRYAFDLSPAGVDARLLGSALFAPVMSDPGFDRALADIQARARARVAEERGKIVAPL